MNNNSKIEELLTGLTPSQQEAVKAEGKGNLRISAGAGSGKTEVLTRRIVSLFEQGIKPDEVVAITYTTKAAAEMKERLIEKRHLPSEKLRKMEISTFHAFLKSFIGEDPFGAGLDRNTEVISTIEKKILINKLVEHFAEVYGNEMMSEETGLGAENANKLVEEFGNALLAIRKYILGPAEFYRLSKEIIKNRDNATQLEINTLEWLYKFYTCYIEELNKRNMLDFDEILIRSGKLIKEMRESGNQPKRKVFLIDEFQDNNKDQFNIVKDFCVGIKNSHICVVGDEKQSIYSFQGADVSTFRDFKADKDIALKDNFRSYSEIIALSDAYLELGGDVGKLFVKQTANRGNSPEPPAVACLLHEFKAPQGPLYTEIVRLIHKMVKSKMPINSRKDKKMRPCEYGDIAIILPSLKGIPREFEQELVKLNIPYVLSSGLGFYGKSEVKEILSFLTLLVTPEDDHSLVKLLTGPLYGLNDSEVAKIFTEGRFEGVNMLPHILAKNESELPKNAIDFRKLFVKLKEIAGKSSLLELCYTILEQAGFNEYVASQDSELKQRRIGNNLQKFLSAVRNFEQNSIYTSIRDFLTYVDSILEEGDEEEAGLGFDDKNVLKIMTIHKSKGLEYPVVICPHIESHKVTLKDCIYFNREMGLIVNEPKNSVNLKKTNSAIFEQYKNGVKLDEDAENRRKLYVAFTRAENKLLIIGAIPPAKKDEEPQGAVVDVVNLLNNHPEWGKVYPFEDRNELIDEWLKPSECEEYKKTLEDMSLAEQSEEQNTETVSKVPELTNQIQAVTSFLRNMENTPDKLKSTKVENLFSMQDLSLFNACPRKYYLSNANIKNFSKNKKNPAAIGGTLVHETIRLYHTYKYHSISDKKEAYNKTINILEKLVRSYGEEGKKCMLKASKILKQYVNSELGSTAPWQTEAEVNVKFDGGFFIRGFADRVDKFENGEIRIVDYKTREYSKEAHERYKRQLTLYMIAVRRGVLGEANCLNFARAYIAYMTPNSLELVEIEPDELNFETEANTIVNKIRTENRWEPQITDKCNMCSYAVLCNINKYEQKSAEEEEEYLFSEDSNIAFLK